MLRAICQISLLMILCGGCSTWHANKGGSYVANYDSAFRASSFAVTQHEKAIKRLDACDYCGAEKVLKEILAADDNYGPAHNSLGKVYFAQQKSYPAACEFDRAAELMEDRPEPFNNLGMVYENVGRLDESIALYEQAYSMDTTNPQYLGNLIRARFRRGDDPIELAESLRTLVAIDHRPGWVAWAKERLNTGQIMRFGGTDCPEIIESQPTDGDRDFLPMMDDVDETIAPGTIEIPIEQLPSPPAFERLENDNGSKKD